jgi:hypothetical protein
MAVLKGALISFMPTFIGALPNVVIFQINPETITHAWTSPAPATTAPKAGADPLAVSGYPGETFAFTLMMDANDEIADGDINPVGAAIASVSGLYSRLAAIEMLQYPATSSGPSLVGSVSAAIGAASASAGGSSTPQNVPRLQVPTVLFVWGPERIVPVRVTQLSVSEKLFDGLLNPSHAEAQLTLKVLTLDDVVNVPEPMKTIATAAYTYTQGLRQVFALANLGDSAATILGMLPSPF